MNPVTAFPVASIGLAGLWLSSAVAPVPLLVLAMLAAAFGASRAGDRRQPAAAFSRRRSMTYR
jgi:hypothetical protein